MRRSRNGAAIRLSLPLILVSTTGAAAQGPSDVPPLFASHELLEFTLEADFRRLKDDRSQESEERPGRLVLAGADGRGGEGVSIELEIKTRGNFRLQSRICPFPPLRIDLPGRGTEGTVVEGQDKLKLVTHCRDSDAYEQNMLEEYLAYRIYGLLTERSFRVRLARVTYLDTSREDDPVTRLAFLLEDEDELAERLGGRLLEVPAAPADAYEPRAAGLLYVFQYLIGNVDWSVTHFHNIKLLRVGTEHFPVPYDFDWSGLVDAPYAGPPRGYQGRIRTVRDRIFAGPCSERIDYGAVFADFRSQRAAIEGLVSGLDRLTERNQKSALDYIEGFYRVIADDRRARREIAGNC